MLLICVINKILILFSIRMSRNIKSYEEHALSAYKEGINGIGANLVNQFLRLNHITDDGTEHLSYTTKNRTLQKVCSIIKGIDSKLVPSPKQRKVYRGITGDFYNLYRSQGIIVNKGYTSSTTDIDTAIAFSQGKIRGVVLEFTIPVGMKIHPYTGRGEHEILIERNTQFINFVEKKIIDNTLFVETALLKYTLPQPGEFDHTTTPTKARALSNELNKALLDELDKDDPELMELFK